MTMKRGFKLAIFPFLMSLSSLVVYGEDGIFGAFAGVEKAIFTGRKEQICGRYKNLVEKGRPKSGPFIKRRSREIFKKSLKGMLPHKTTRGREALKRIKMYKGVPARLQETKTETLESANVSKVPNLKYIRLEELTKFLGGR